MKKIIFNHKSFDCRDSETVLEACLRHGINVPFSCRNGICHTCLLRSLHKSVPAAAQKGVKQSLKDKGYFLACKCVPEDSLEVALPRNADLYSKAIVYKKELLAPDVCRLLLEPATSLYYHPGQNINLRRNDGLTRCYSLASVPTEDYYLELHIKRIPGGIMSNWIFDVLQEDDELDFQGAIGQCYYTQTDPTQKILLIATGTGMAPLLGIARDALNSGHSGDIYIYHGSHYASGLYLHQSLLQMSNTHSNLHYYACVSGRDIPEGYINGRAHDVALRAHDKLQNWQVYLCGLPQMVYAAQQAALASGANREQILTDPYENASSFDNTGSMDSSEPQVHGAAGAAVKSPMEHQEEPSDYPQPNPEMWAALKNGALLTEILTDFYSQVYDDPRLNSFFEDTTKQRAIEKQYSFLRQVFTGEDVYFGDRPRNAHHWMVISDELMDYREELMMSCLRRHGLPEHLIRQWREMEEGYRKYIVKDKPWNKIAHGVVFPLDGYEELVLTEGTLCDNCEAEIDCGETVRYHVRLGKTYCSNCTKNRSGQDHPV